MSDLTPELDAALKAAREAGDIIARYAKLQVAVEHKSPEQPVTIADREANERIKQVLLDAFPEDGWLSEETKDTPERLAKKRVWIVDPLDGTKEFIAGVPEYAVSIALSIDGAARVGVIFNPATQDLYHAVSGRGAFLNGALIRASSEGCPEKARILASNSEMNRGEWDRFKGTFGAIVRAGGLAYKMAEVARGRADGSFSLTPKNEWDFAAGLLLIEEAGGRVTDEKGQAFKLNKADSLVHGIVYANPDLHRRLMTLIG